MSNHVTPPGEDALLERLRQLERRVAELETADQLHSASFRAPGIVRYRDMDGNVLFALGGVTAGGVNSDGLQLTRPDGTDALQFYDNGTGHVVVILDEAGRGVFATDTESGMGLARPYLPLPFCHDLLQQERTTTAAAFESLWRIDCNVQHPAIRLKMYGRSIGGATGEIRVRDDTDDVVLGTVRAIANGEYVGFAFDADVPESWWGAYHDLRVEARVTNGTGSIGVEVTGAYGVQS